MTIIVGRTLHIGCFISVVEVKVGRYGKKVLEKGPPLVSDINNYVDNGNYLLEEIFRLIVITIRPHNYSMLIKFSHLTK